MVLTRLDASQPYYSKITFDTLTDTDVQFWQEDKTLRMTENGGATRDVAGNLKYLAFTYAETDNDSIVSLSISFEKKISGSRTKALQMAVEKVRVMNN